MAAAMNPCIFFQQGRCRNGDACRFSHASTPASTIPAPHLRPDPRSQVPCTFYLEGICKQGAKCPYRHEPSDPSSAAPGPSQHDDDTFVRVFRGALVRYGDGACVTNVSLPSENSSVRLDGLAANTTTTDLITILEGLGHDIEVDGIRIVATPRSPHWSAYLSTLDPEFPKTLSASLIDTPYRNLKAVPVPPRLPAWASTRRVRCNKLDLKWTPPPHECTIFFATLATALRVRGKFIHGKYKVLNTRLRCNEPPLKVADGAYAITLSGLPDDYSDGMVYGAIKANYDEPLLVVEPYQLTWKKFTTRSIRELLHDIAPVDFMTEPYEHDDGHWTACAHFKQDCDAQKAAQLIEKRSLVLPHDDVPLEADLLYTSTFKTSKEVFNHIQTRLEDRLEELGAPRMNVVCRETGTVFLGLDSPDPEEVAKCADAIEDILAGDVIDDKDGKHFWVSQLACNGPASKILKEIQQRHGVLLLPNKSKREVRYFGGSSKQMAVQEDVVRSLTANVEMRHTVDIDDAGLSWLCKTGLNLLTAVVGDKVVSLNVTSNPKKLVITGSDVEHCHVLALLEMNNVSFAVKEIRSEESCSICFTPADDPVVLGCGHTYCTDCFKGLCKNGPTQADMNVTCTGAEDRCKNAIPLREIRAIADPSVFEQLLESSFSTYIARRPNQFHYCPTPDCGYVYRPASDSASSLWHMCPKCLQWICRSCHANHKGQRCEEHRATQTFEVYKHENRDNVKDCPECRTTVEKIDGCNHIKCGGCNIHLCWVCLKTFRESAACYAHMHDVHGGIGIYQPEVEEEEEEEEEDDDDDM